MKRVNPIIRLLQNLLLKEQSDHGFKLTDCHWIIRCNKISLKSQFNMLNILKDKNGRLRWLNLYGE